jgi:hypothetical protein
MSKVNNSYLAVVFHKLRNNTHPNATVTRKATKTLCALAFLSSLNLAHLTPIAFGAEEAPIESSDFDINDMQIFMHEIENNLKTSPQSGDYSDLYPGIIAIGNHIEDLLNKNLNSVSMPFIKTKIINTLKDLKSLLNISDNQDNSTGPNDLDFEVLEQPSSTAKVPDLLTTLLKALQHVVNLYDDLSQNNSSTKMQDPPYQQDIPIELLTAQIQDNVSNQDTNNDDYTAKSSEEEEKEDNDQGYNYPTQSQVEGQQSSLQYLQEADEIIQQNADNNSGYNYDYDYPEESSEEEEKEDNDKDSSTEFPAWLKKPK